MVKKKKSSDEASALHSITFYMPSKTISFFNEALREVSKKIYQNNSKRCVSKYIRNLIYSDLKKRNLLTDDNSPNSEELARLKNENDNDLGV